MPRRILPALCLACLFSSPLASAAEAAPEVVEPPTVAAPLELTALALESGRDADTAVLLRGPEAREQLVATGTTADGRMVDMTGQVTYASDPEGIVRVTETGLVIPLDDGQATVTAQSASGPSAAISLTVDHYHSQIPINFPNQIVPIFTKLGCNGGGCHGKASGQNGFKLSLLGFEPPEDYEYLVKEARGRRLFPAAADRSLVLLKATNTIPHGGGARLERDSVEYRLIRRWISQGMPYGNPEDPTVARIEVFPDQRSLSRHAPQQLTVIAHYTDGSSEDVTRMAQFEANDPEMAEADVTGRIETLDLSGDVAIMARYQGHVGVFRATVPLGAPMEGTPEPRNFIDEAVFAKLDKLGVPPSQLSNDATFLRRVTLDVAGRLPTLDESRAFLADDGPDKRDRLIDRLLDGPDYADYFANKWAAVLRNKRRDANYRHGTFAFHSWIRESLYENKPYDQFVREIIAAAGEAGQNPAVIWYRELNEINEQVEDTAQLFLGLRIQCARCHHHPFEKWSQDDYYGMAAFFSRVGRKAGAQQGEQRIYHSRGAPTAKNPKTNEQLGPTPLGTEPVEVAADHDPRQVLVDWMADPDNPFFARALVNRYWKHFFDRGIVDPEDDMRVTNPATNPQLLDGLAAHFIESGFDLKDLVRTICQSSVYQLDSNPNEYNLTDKQNFSRYYPKRLQAEVLLDAINQVTATSTGFSGLPAGTSAVQLPDQASDTYFLTVFGRPQADTACECERSQEANLAQSLHLLNSAEIQGKLTADTGRAAMLAGDDARSPEERIGELYLWVYSRPPDAEELQIATAHIAAAENKRAAYEDIVWALINTKEFLFNH